MHRNRKHNLSTIVLHFLSIYQLSQEGPSFPFSYRHAFLLYIQEEWRIAFLRQFLWYRLTEQSSFSLRSISRVSRLGFFNFNGAHFIAYYNQYIDIGIPIVISPCVRTIEDNMPYLVSVVFDQILFDLC